MNTDMLRTHGYDPRGPGADRRYGMSTARIDAYRMGTGYDERGGQSL